jgi:hypothetical protein
MAVQRYTQPKTRLPLLHHLAERLASAFVTGSLPTGTGWMLQALIPDIQLFRICVLSGSNMLLSTENLLADVEPQLVVHPVGQTVAGLSMLRKSCFQAVCLGPTKILDMNHAYDAYHCSSIACVPFEHGSLSVNNHSESCMPCLGAITIGRATTSDVDTKLWAKLMLLAQYLGAYLARDAHVLLQCLPRFTTNTCSCTLQHNFRGAPIAATDDCAGQDGQALEEASKREDSGLQFGGCKHVIDGWPDNNGSAPGMLWQTSASEPTCMDSLIRAPAHQHDFQSMTDVRKAKLTTTAGLQYALPGYTALGLLVPMCLLMVLILSGAHGDGSLVLLVAVLFCLATGYLNAVQGVGENLAVIYCFL